MDKPNYKEHNFSPWHDIGPGNINSDIVNAIIEIPQGSKCKYELDKPSGLLKLDRILYSSIHYPANYGLVPQTYFTDDDPLDILVFASIPFVPMCLVEARVIGSLKMTDEKGRDDKVIAVAHRDMAYNHITALTQMPEFSLAELRNFFEDYKKLEGKAVDVLGFDNKDSALRCIQESITRYNRKFRS
jgi:inorganic pyrophosphatase